MHSIIALVFAVFAVVPSFSASSFTPKDLLSAPRSGPAIPNPNGTVAVYAQSSYSFDNDSHTGGLYLLPITTKTITSSKNIIDDTNASDPVWLNDSTILYIYTEDGRSSLRTYDIDSEQGLEIHSFDGSVGNLEAFPLDDGAVRIAFSAKVCPSGRILRANETDTPEVLVYDRLWVRHWDEWITSPRNSIFAGTLTAKHGPWSFRDKPRNMLNSTGLECPIPPFGGDSDFSVSSTLLAFIAKDPHLNPATNTASHVYVVAFNDSTYLEQINRGSGASSSPVWSPDGDHLAYLEMRVRGYEADRGSSDCVAYFRSSSCGVHESYS